MHPAIHNIRKLCVGREESYTSPAHTFFKSPACGVQISSGNMGYNKFIPNPQQQKVLAFINDNDNSVIVGPRQSGISTAVMGYFLYEFLNAPHPVMGITANSFAQAKHTLEEFRDLLLSVMPVGNIEVDNRNEIRLKSTGAVITIDHDVNAFKGMAIKYLYFEDCDFGRTVDQKINNILPVVNTINGSRVILGSSGVGIPPAFLKNHPAFNLLRL